MPAKFDKLQISKLAPTYGGGDQYVQTRNAGYINTTDNSSFRYFHIMLNVGGDDSMWMAEAVGYNYGTAQPIRSSLGWYAYQGNVYSQATSNGYSGLSAITVYPASSLYNYNSVLVFLGTSVYYAGFVLNVYNMRANTSGQINPTINAWTITSNSSPVY